MVETKIFKKLEKIEILEDFLKSSEVYELISVIPRVYSEPMGGALEGHQKTYTDLLVVYRDRIEGNTWG